MATDRSIIVRAILEMVSRQSAEGEVAGLLQQAPGWRLVGIEVEDEDGRTCQAITTAGVMQVAHVDGGSVVFQAGGDLTVHDE